MKVSLNGLLKYIAPIKFKLPDALAEFQDLLEDIGLEVKKCETTPDDIIFTLELLANRGDHHSYTGLAREIHLRTGWPLTQVETLKLTPGASPNVIVASDACLAYTLTEYELKGSQQELGHFQQALIQLSGTNIIAPAVDITNFVNIELGQPMHVFDANKIVGAIEVRNSKPGEFAHLLGAKGPVELPENTLIIADAEKTLAVAGVMGCETSKPDKTSQRLLLESGTFDPVAVRKAAKALGVQSLSSARFERGADPLQVVNAVYRAHRLLVDAGWEAVAGLGVAKAYATELPFIDLSLARLKHYFALEVTAAELEAVFKRMGSDFIQASSDQIRVQVPSHRIWDLVNEADLFEEYARAVGYNTLPSVMPKSASGARPSQYQRRLEEIESLLVSEGFFEIFTDSFYSDQDVARLGSLPDAHPLQQHVRINNSETKAYSLLKNNNLVQALGAVETNANIKKHDFKVFERNKRFIPDSTADNGLCHELEVIWGLGLGENLASNWQRKGQLFDIYALKGLLERMSARLGLGLQIMPQPDQLESHPYLVLLHPQRRAVIQVETTQGLHVCGVLGEVHPGVVKSFGLKFSRPYFFEFELSVLHNDSHAKPYNAPTMILPVKRDLCFGLYHQQSAGYIANWLASQSQCVERVEINDLFNTEDDAGQSVRAVTFSIYLDPLRAGKEVFSGSEINDEVERLAVEAVQHFSADQVVRR